MIETFKLSQSAIKAWYKEQYDEGCKYRFYLRYIEGIQPEETGEFTAMKKGQLFESIVIGRTRDQEAINIPRLKNGGMPKPEQDIISLAEFARNMIERLGIEILEVQPTLETETRKGHPDFYASYGKDPKVVFDLKYTETTADDRFRGWGDPTAVDHTQALDYVDLYHQQYGEFPAFMYLVFGKSGWIKFIQVLLTPATLYRHRRMADELQKELSTRTSYPATTSFNTCSACELYSVCEKKLTLPKLETIEL